jgi:hypothetical protein
MKINSTVKALFLIIYQIASIGGDISLIEIMSYDG